MFNKLGFLSSRLIDSVSVAFGLILAFFAALFGYNRRLRPQRSSKTCSK